MSPLKRWLIAVGVVAVLGVIVYASIRSRAAEGTKVYTEPVGRRDMVARVKASGEIDPRVKVKISAHVIGRIEKLFVKEGDRIEAGQPFLELERTGFVAARDQSAALLQSAETAVRQADVHLADARRQERRAVELSAQGIVTQEQLDAAHLRATSAELDLDRARDGVHQARAALDKARDDLAKTTIFAPLAGRVIELNAEEGEVVVSGTMNNPASVIGTIADLSELLAVVDVDETEIVDVALGQEATVDVDAVPGTTYHGQVVEVGSSGYAKPRQPDVTYFRVKVLIADADDGLRPGMSARVAIRTAGHDGVLAVPIQSVVERPPAGAAEKATAGAPAAATPAGDKEPEKVVFVVAAGKAKRLAVATGIADTTHVEITSGLAGGEEVVTGPYRSLRDLKDGEAVRVTTPEAGEKEKGGKGADAKDEKDERK
jgi:HlyD family secretion protein